jgi:hypothetical protein
VYFYVFNKALTATCSNVRISGSFVAIVDAVKGPFFPKPPPFPTSTGHEYDNADEAALWCPPDEKDPGVYTIPETQFG